MGSRCRFGELEALHSVWRSAFEMVCVAPAQAAGRYAVQVASNGQDWTDNAAEFAYYAPLRVEAVRPELGPELGGTLVEVAGEGEVWVVDSYIR